MRLDDDTLRLLDGAERAGLGARSDLVREAIRAHLGAAARAPRPWDVVGERAGCMSGPADLATRASEHVKRLVRERLARPR